MARFAITFVAAIALSANALHAAVVPIFSSGLSTTGTLLPDTTIDPHYTLVQYPGQVGITPASTYVLSGITFSYDVSGTASKWISWSPTWVNATPAGQWTYRTTFDLAGFLPATANITGRFLVDDDATIFLNGVNTGITGSSSSSYTNFNFSSGFIGGVNTLDFRVNNANFVAFNPSALRVEVAGTASAVPEPSSALLALASLTGLLAMPGKRNRLRA